MLFSISRFLSFSVPLSRSVSLFSSLSPFLFFCLLLLISSLIHSCYNHTLPFLYPLSVSLSRSIFPILPLIIYHSLLFLLSSSTYLILFHPLPPSLSLSLSVSLTTSSSPLLNKQVPLASSAVIISIQLYPSIRVAGVSPVSPDSICSDWAAVCSLSLWLPSSQCRIAGVWR